MRTLKLICLPIIQVIPAKKVARDKTRPKSKFNWKTLQSIKSETITILKLDKLAANFIDLKDEKTQIEKDSKPVITRNMSILSIPNINISLIDQIILKQTKRLLVEHQFFLFFSFSFFQPFVYPIISSFLLHHRHII